MVLSLITSPYSGAAIGSVEAATLELRRQALKNPAVMQHTRFQCPYPMLVDQLKQDLVLKSAFPINRQFPPLGGLGGQASHLKAISDAEEALGLQVGDEATAFIAANRRALEAVDTVLQSWLVELPAELELDPAVCAWQDAACTQLGQPKVGSECVR